MAASRNRPAQVVTARRMVAPATTYYGTPARSTLLNHIDRRYPGPSKYPHSLTSTATTVISVSTRKTSLSNAAEGFAHVITNRLRRGELRHHFIIDVEVRRYALHVVVIFRPSIILSTCSAGRSREHDGILGHHRDASPHSS